MVGCAFSLLLYPLGAPNEIYFILAGCSMNVFRAPLKNSPLVNDYVCKESRGQAISFGMMGWTLAVIMSLQLLYNFTKDMDPMPQWAIPSVLMLFFAFTCLCLISEPKVINIERRKKNYLVQMKELVHEVCQAAKSNQNLIFGWVL